MEYRRLEREEGFTLIELLVVIAILGVLSSIAITTYSEIRDRAYTAHAESMMQMTRTALAAGKIDLDILESGGNFWAWTTPEGVFEGFPSTDFVPGVVLHKDTRLSVGYNGWCQDWASSDPWCDGQMCCVVDIITAYHCNGGKVKDYFVWNNGLVIENEWNSWGC